MHLTLLFLGERPVDEAPELCHVVGHSAREVSGFRLVCDGVTCFSWPPRLLFLRFREAQGADRFEQTARAIRGALEQAGLPVPPESKVRRVVPHLTLVRFRGVRDQRTLGALARFEKRSLVWRAPLPEPTAVPPVLCERITLFRSLQGPGGARYQPIDTFDMAPSAHK